MPKLAQFKIELLVGEMKFALIIVVVVIIFSNCDNFVNGRLIKQDGGKFTPSQRIPLMPRLK